jgi:hypothetical protein
MRLRHLVAVAAMHARDLSRRRVSLALLILLPIVLYMAAELAPADPATAEFLAENPGERDPNAGWILTTGGIGPLWSVATATLFVILGSRRIDQRLLLSGFRALELLAGRILTVLGLGAVITPLFAALIWSLRDVDLGLLVASIALLVIVAVGHGVAIAALVRDEMEGVLAIIGVTGVEMMIVGQEWLPMWGATELLLRAGGQPGTAEPATAVLHALGYSAALVGIGAVAWSRKVRLTAVAHLPVGELAGTRSPERSA